MSRLQRAVFALLALATIGAFYLTQHIKVSTPFINGAPQADPPAINPLAGGICTDLVGDRVSFRRTRIGFYLQNSSDHVDVYVVNSAGQIIATAAGSGRYMQATLKLNAPRSYFTWNGHESNGQLAPDGTYYFKIVLQSHDREIVVTQHPVQVISAPPVPRVTSVTVTGQPTAKQSGPAVISPPRQTVTIRWKKGPYRSARVLVYRAGTSAGQKLTLVKSFGADGRVGHAVWDGRIDGRPAVAGTYLIGLSVIDNACTPGKFPVVNPPSLGTTGGAGVSVRYLAATPPLTPVPAGQLTTVGVYDAGSAYNWSLRRSDGARVIYHGHNPASDTRMALKIPNFPAGLYQLTLTAGPRSTTVPLVAQLAGPRSATARVLVVLPALSWQGSNPVDNDGSGLPDTLSTPGQQVALDRPLVAGLPADYADEAGVLAYLDRHQLRYQLTTDVALAQGVGPRLQGHSGVILDGTFSWLPTSLVQQLHGYVEAGGRVLSLGVGSLQYTATLSRGSAGPLATAGTALSPDPFGAKHGQLSTTGGELITAISDRLGIFGSTVAFSGYRGYQAIFQPSGPVGSLAGVAPQAPAISGFRLGSGAVVEVGLPKFGASLAGNVTGQALMAGAWRLLTR